MEKTDQAARSLKENKSGEGKLVRYDRSIGISLLTKSAAMRLFHCY